MTARTSALRRRRKPSLARRIRTFWVFIVLGFIAAGALVYAASVVLALPLFHAHPVDVTIDGTAVTKDEVLAAAAVDPNANVWFLSTRRIAARIEALPYVDAARIERSAPARLAIAVTERAR